MLLKFGRSFALYLAVVVVALLVRVSLTFGSVAGVAAYSTSMGSERSVGQVVSDASIGMASLVRALSHGQSRQDVAATGIFDLRKLVGGSQDGSSPPQRAPLIIRIGD